MENYFYRLYQIKLGKLSLEINKYDLTFITNTYILQNSYNELLNILFSFKKKDITKKFIINILWVINNNIKKF